MVLKRLNGHVADLRQMLTYCTYAGNNDFPDLSRHSPTLLEGQRRIGLQLVELHNFHKNRRDIPLQAGPLNLI